MHKRSFTYLLGTQTMSNAVDILYIMALVSLVFHETDSIFSSVLVPLLRMGAQMISGFLAPLILARFQLPFILFVSQFTNWLSSLSCWGICGQRAQTRYGCLCLHW